MHRCAICGFDAAVQLTDNLRVRADNTTSARLVNHVSGNVNLPVTNHRPFQSVSPCLRLVIVKRTLHIRPDDEKAINWFFLRDRFSRIIQFRRRQTGNRME